MSLRITISLFSLTILCIFPIVTHADTWAMPKERSVCSVNNKYCLKVIPKKLTNQLDYFGDKVDEKENAGADKGAKNNKCRGIFYVRDANGILRKRWEIDLLNEVAPVDVLVSDQGDYVITFDNWHSVGYGDDVVAIYSATSGKLIKNFGLSEFLTEHDIHSLPRSTSSIWWGDEHFIDQANRQLVLQVAKGKRTFEKDVKYFQIRVELSSGKVLDEKRDRFSSLQFKIEQIGELNNVDENVLEGVAVACLNGEDANRITNEELTERIKSEVLPEYPPAAKAVRAQGTVIVAIRVNKDGTVACSEAISGHPLLRATLVNAAKKWTFVKAEIPYSSYLVFKGGWFLVNPDGTTVEEK